MVATIEALHEAAQTFFAQDDARVLVVTCNDDDAVALLAALSATPEHARGITVPLPDPWDDAARTALFEAIPSDGVLGVVLCETSRQDVLAHARRTIALLTDGAPWQSRVRWIVRDTVDPPTLRGSLLGPGAPSCRWTTFARSHGDDEARLAEAASDPARPTTQRLASLFQLAWMDVSHGRHAEAVDRFGVLHEAYGAREDVAMQSLCLQGVASVYRFRHDAASALAWFQRAVATALPKGVSTALLGALTGAAETSYEVGSLAESEQYFGDAARVAAAMREWVPLCDALVKAGIVAVAREDSARAVWHWEQCRRVAAKMEHTEARQDVLARLEGLYTQAGLHDHAAHASAERIGLAREAS